MKIRKPSRTYAVAKEEARKEAETARLKIQALRESLSERDRIINDLRNQVAQLSLNVRMRIPSLSQGLDGSLMIMAPSPLTHDDASVLRECLNISFPPTPPYDQS